VLQAARYKCRTQKSRQKSPSGHHPTNLSGYIFATKACIDNRKKLVKQQYLLYMSHNMVNFGPLAAEIVSLVSGTPGNFNGFRVWAALLHGTLVVGVSQAAALNRGRHLYSAFAHISSSFLLSSPNLTTGCIAEVMYSPVFVCLSAHLFVCQLHQNVMGGFREIEE